MALTKEPEVVTSKGALVRTFSVQIVVNCTCGAPEPIVIHMIPGLSAIRFICPACRTEYKLMKFIFDGAVSGNVQIGVGMVPPDLVVPKVS